MGEVVQLSRNQLNQEDEEKGSRENTGGKVTASALRQMLERQGYRCLLTGSSLVPELAQVDHMVPISRGGKHSIDNVCIIRTDINKAKGTMAIDEFVSMCVEVAKHRGSLCEK